MESMDLYEIIGEEKPYWLDTCYRYNDCSICPYGRAFGEGYECGVDK